MIEKIGTIKNPLTIIAIFAAIAEISGTGVLPFIAPTNQATYVWFLIVFPILLILLFFLTLNFNHTVLYAPSDYSNEDNFLRNLPRSTYAEKARKINVDLAESGSSEDETESPSSGPSTEITDSSVTMSHSCPTFVQRNSQANYMLAEELIFAKLSKEFGSQIQRDVKVGASTIIDGIVRQKGVTTIIEIKYFRQMPKSLKLRETLRSLQKAVEMLPNEQGLNLRLLLAVATEDGILSGAPVASQIDRYRSDFPFPIEVRFYDLAELESEFKMEP